ncbi:MAG: hypothetical protein WCT16_03445 [Candidatus Buchananbacteria bacterium]
MANRKKTALLPKPPRCPAIGQIIYVGPGPECTGGRARVTETKIQFKGKKKVFFVKLDIHPRGLLNWTGGLRQKQKELEKKYGETLAKYDPDDDYWGVDNYWA